VEFSATETQSLVQRTAREFAERVLRPLAAEIDARSKIPDTVVRGLGELGLLAVNVSADAGGAEAGAVAYALAVQEIARACASTAVTMSVTNMVCEAIVRFGTTAQAQHYVSALAGGREGNGCFALSEPEAGSDPGAMTTRARRDGGERGEWIIDGAKQWISGGNGARVFIVWARTAAPDANTGPTKGISCFLVDAGAPGLRVGRPEDKMGLRGSSTVPLEFSGCRAASMLGGENEGFKIAMMALDGGRIGISSQAIGIARAALEESVAYAKDRRAFGVPIAEHQAIQWKLADMRTRIDAAQLLSMRAAWMKEKNAPFSREAAMAKLFASEAAIAVCNDAVQIHGGYGYTRDFPAERHLRDARVTTIYEGTSEIQRIVIARSALVHRFS
jgi:alkylation response protein AidB-like acyl-CoA dehydrogenase